MTGAGNLVSLARRMPGVEGFWVFISGDILLFTLLFGSYSYQRTLDIAAYEASQRQLYPLVAALNTFFLLTSSWLVALGVAAKRRCEDRRAAGFVAGGILFGIAFVLNKAVEYGLDNWGGSIVPEADFAFYYFLITGLHLLHVIGGLIILTVAWSRLRAPTIERNDMVLLESGASFWHMVDLLWLIIFPLIYLVK